MDSTIAMRWDLYPKPLSYNPISEAQMEKFHLSISSILTIWLENVGEFALDVE